MADYVLSCCSTADLSKEHFEKRGIPYICFHYQLNGREYPDDLGQTVPFDEFYAQMAQGADTATSQVNITEYVDFFSAFAGQGKDIVHVSLSSGISGTVNSGYGLLMDTAADMRDRGLSAPELAKWIEDNRLKLHHWFFSTDLSSYVRGGRISKTAAVFGGLLDICPLLNMDNLGRLIPRYKIRTKKKVIRTIVDKMEACARDGLDYDGKCYISQSACYEDARQVADLVEERFKKLNGPVEINSIGTTIGAHTGPGTVALFFWGTERKD